MTDTAAPAPAPPADDVPEPAARPNMRRRAFAVLGIVLLVALIVWAVMHFLLAKPEEETDDAYVAGDVVAITARDPGTVVERLCEALGIDVQPKMLEACGARKVMNTDLGDPNFHKHDRIEAQTADNWRQFYSEDALTLETRRLMESLGVGGR